MNDRGTFAVARSDYHDPDFDGDEFSPRDAWHFLVGSACYSPTRTRIAGIVVGLDRGQCGFSIRFLAEKWGWSKSRVDRFLDRIEASGKIHRERVGTGKSPGITVLTVCHYSAMQGRGPSVRQETGTAAGQQRDSSGGTAIAGNSAVDFNDLDANEICDRDSFDAPRETADRDSSGTKKDSETQDTKIDSSLRSESATSQGDAADASMGDGDRVATKRKAKPRKHAWPEKYFDEFWSAWPKKVDIAEAKKVLERIYRDDDVSFSEIIIGVHRLAETIKTKEDKQFCKGPARWLRCAAWTNEVVGRPVSENISTKSEKGMTLAGQSKSWWFEQSREADERLREKANGQRNDHASPLGPSLDHEPRRQPGDAPEPRHGQRPDAGRPGAAGGSGDGRRAAFATLPARIPGW